MIFKLYSKRYETLIFKVCSKGQTQNKPYLNRSQFFTFRNTSSKCTSILFRGFKGIVKRDFFFIKSWVVGLLLLLTDWAVFIFSVNWVVVRKRANKLFLLETFFFDGSVIVYSGLVIATEDSYIMFSLFQ